jgi:hypothetical protein
MSNKRFLVSEKLKKPHAKPWFKPPSGSVKLKINVSYKCDNCSAGIGMVLHDDAGTVIFSGCRSLRANEEALEAELMVHLEVLQLAMAHISIPNIINTDCSQLISVVLATSHVLPICILSLLFKH